MLSSSSNRSAIQACSAFARSIFALKLAMVMTRTPAARSRFSAPTVSGHGFSVRYASRSRSRDSAVKGRFMASAV